MKTRLGWPQFTEIRGLPPPPECVCVSGFAQPRPNKMEFFSLKKKKSIIRAYEYEKLLLHPLQQASEYFLSVPYHLLLSPEF